MDGVLIVGAGQAGLHTALTLREFDAEIPISMVGAEAIAPYRRPPLSKAFLVDDADDRSLLLCDEESLATKAIEFDAGEHIAYVDLDRGSALATSGREFRFERLVLATGARASRLAVPGADLSGVVCLRGRDDAVRLREYLRSATDVVVVGGGYLGLEVAASCRSVGKAVTLVEASSRLLAHLVAPPMSQFFADAHTQRGVKVRTGCGVLAIEGTGGVVSHVALSDGSQVRADVVVVAVGAQPRSELAAQLSLELHRNHVVVDASATTSDPRVLAVGDCTAFPVAGQGGALAMIPSVQNAVEQAEVAASTLAGKVATHTSVPWFWSDQYDVKFQVAGRNHGYDNVVQRGKPGDARPALFYFRGDELLAADLVNRPGDFLLVRRWLSRQTAIEKQILADASTPLAAAGALQRTQSDPASPRAKAQAPS